MKTASHNSSWGRIGLMLKADLINNKLTLSLYALCFLGIFVLLPRFPLLFEWNYNAWLSEHLVTYSVPQLVFFSLFGAHIYSTIYVLVRSQHGQPTTFSTLPLSLREKFVSMNLFIACVVLLGFIVVACSYLIECLLIPNFSSLIEPSVLQDIIFNAPLKMMELDGSLLNKFSLILVVSTYCVLYPLFAYGLMWLNSVYLRKPFLSLIAFYLEMLIYALFYAFSLFWVVNQCKSGKGCLFSLSFSEANVAIFSIGNFVWAALLVGIVYCLLWRRLRTIPY